MPRYAIIENNLVVNNVVASEEFAAEQKWILASDDVGIGWSLVNGEWIAPPPPPVIIPTLTMRQARLALLDVGLLDGVEAAITTTENRIWWDYSTTVERSHPLVNAVLTSLGKTEAEIDDMFIAAAQL